MRYANLYRESVQAVWEIELNIMHETITDGEFVHLKHKQTNIQVQHLRRLVDIVDNSENN